MKNKNIKIIFVCLFPLWGLGGFMQAQTQYRHEFSVNAGGGLSTLQYKPSTGDKDLLGIGGVAGLGYTLFFNPQWGLGTGAEIGCYNSKFTNDGSRLTYLTTTPPGLTGNFYLNADFSKYEETQNALYLQIPLMLQFQTKGVNKFYAALGGRIGIPLSATWESEGEVTTTGYSDYTGQTYDQKNHGFDTYAVSTEGDLDLDLAYIGSAELGMKWKLGNRTSLYTGIYADYAFNDVRKNDATSEMIVYNPATPTTYASNSVVQSQSGGSAIADKVSPLAVGLKLRLSIGAGKDLTKAKEEKPAVVVEKPAPPKTVVDESAQRAAEAKRKADEEAARQRAEAERLAQEKAAVEAAKAQATKTGIQQPVEHYAVSQVELTAAQKQELDQKITLLQQNPMINFYIYGHTCDLGGDEINERVGLQRAEKAKEYMLAKGVAANRVLGTASKLDREPLVPNTNEENRRINRRVEIKVVE